MVQDNSSKPKIICVAGARPNFMKIGPIIRAIGAEGTFAPVLVHTGQHYDADMNDSFFTELQIPRPDINLQVGSGSHAVQTAEVMRRFEPVLDQFAGQAAATLVVGDVNSTLACALVATKRGVRVVHVEAGLRSFDRGMPEEINRVLTDQISDLLFTTERSALANLVREGIDPAKVHFVGNVMIDSLLSHLERAVPAQTIFAGAGRADFARDGYAVLTLHRPANVDHPATLSRLIACLVEISDNIPIAFPVHPRTRGRIEAAGLAPQLARPSILMLPPMSYLSMLGLMRNARLALTDSGGIQEETTALGIPCVTLRENTERPITVEQGTNTVVGTDPQRIRDAVGTVLASGGKAGRRPEFWDGRAAMRIAEILGRELRTRGSAVIG